MNFLLGCNYWASNAGADMWRKYDKDVIREDLKALSSYGVSHMRVFPNWRDFQPIMPQYRVMGELNGYCMEGDIPADNPYYLDGTMMEHFSEFLDICDEYGIKVVVGLITGWMSGRLYVPTALYGKNVITDSTAIYFEQLFIRGFVSAFKNRDTVYAWDLGNECNCMGEADRIQAVSWTATIANAIRAEDPTRPIVSGMHGIEVAPESAWQIRDQAMWNDILTTHPYPYWCAHTRNDEILSLRTTMHATAQNKYYSECGGKPCLAEEIGTMGPMLASNETSAKFLRTNLFSLWANGSAGLMWWCGHEQTMLDTFPYSENMVEVELGLLNPDRSPKPVMLEIKKFSDFLKSLDITLPEAKTDAVCLLTHGQRQWGVCYTTHILARQAGLNFRFAYADDGIPESDTYILPSVNGIRVMDSKIWHELKNRVYNGAKIYISMDNGVLSELEAFTGMRIEDSYEAPTSNSFYYLGKCFDFDTKRTYKLKSVGASIEASDKNGNPVITAYTYGKGRVLYVNFPLEAELIDKHDAFGTGLSEIYKYLFYNKYESRPVKVDGEVAVTLHENREEGKIYAVAVNHTSKKQKISIDSGEYVLSRVLYGSEKAVNAYDASVMEFVRK